MAWPNPTSTPTVSRSLSLLAGEISRIRVPGRYVRCSSATAEFQIRFDESLAAPMQGGQQLGGKEFEWLTFDNRSANTNAIEIIVSFSGVEDARPVVNTVVNSTAKDPPTYTKATTCGVGATATFNGLDTAQQRKQIIVQNCEKTVADGGTGQYIEVGDTTNSSGLRLQLAPGQMLTLVTNGVIKVTVPGGCAPGTVLETFYS